jgi:hypothetical protein
MLWWDTCDTSNWACQEAAAGEQQTREAGGNRIVFCLELSVTAALQLVS